MEEVAVVLETEYIVMTETRWLARDGVQFGGSVILIDSIRLVCLHNGGCGFSAMVVQRHRRRGGEMGSDLGFGSVVVMVYTDQTQVDLRLSLYRTERDQTRGLQVTENNYLLTNHGSCRFSAMVVQRHRRCGGEMGSDLGFKLVHKPSKVSLLH